MGGISVDKRLYEQIEQVAREAQTNVSDVLNEAIRMYLWELQRERIAKEYEVYRQRHSELVKRYRGQYIAMYKGEIVDHDEVFEALYRRVRTRFGSAPVMITRVEDTPFPEIKREGIRV